MLQRNEFIENCTKLLLFTNAFMVEAIFRQRSYTDKSIDLQIILKLGLWVFTFLFCIFLFRRWGTKFLRIDNIFQVFLLIDIFISCSYAPNPVYSLACAFSLLAVVFLLLLSSSVLTNMEIIRQIIRGCTLVAFISIIVYFVNPDFGRMKEWVDGVHVPGRRLAGITGTANTMGYISALCLLCLYYYRQYSPKLTKSYWVFIAINLLALLMSNSRTSLVAMLASIGIAGLMRPTIPRIFALFFGICFITAFFSLVDTSALFATISRSGQASEIESGTGRTAIWKEAIELIGERPLFGWGYGAATYVLTQRAAAIGEVVDHAHNAWLQVTLSVGLVGLFFFIVLLIIKLYYSLRSGQQLNLALLVFLLIDGLTEPIAFTGVATTTTLALATVLALNYGNRDETPHTAYQ